MKFGIVYFALLFTALFFNSKITSFVRAVAFNEYESKNDSIITFVLMILSVTFWTIFISLL